MEKSVETSDDKSFVHQVREALLQVDLKIFGEMNRALRDGTRLVEQARLSLVEALADARVDERELLNTRLLVLKAMAAMRPFTPHGSRRSDHLLKVVGALKGVADCFFEYELVVQPLNEGEASASIGSGRGVTFAEFSLDQFEAKLQQLLTTIQDMSGAAEAQPPEESPETSEPVTSDPPLLRAPVGYLEAIHRHAIPGCVYGTQARRENPYLAARALRAGCGRLQGMLLSRHAMQEPLERLAKLEGRLTSLIEEVREAGAPLEEHDGWLRLLRASKLDALRAMCQDLMELEQTLREQSPEREQ